jgi:hypothetical protein
MPASMISTSMADKRGFGHDLRQWSATILIWQR